MAGPYDDRVSRAVKLSELFFIEPWTWENFDEISGVSYLPYDGGTYRQAPYEECSQDDYEKLKASIPHINWEELKENSDNVEGAQQLVCTAGACEI